MMAVRQARVAEISSLAASRAVVLTLLSLVLWLKYWKSDSGASSLQMLPTMMLMTAKVPADSTGRSGAVFPVLEGSWAGGAVHKESPSPSPSPRGHWGDILGSVTPQSPGRANIPVVAHSNIPSQA